MPSLKRESSRTTKGLSINPNNDDYEFSTKRRKNIINPDMLYEESSESSPKKLKKIKNQPIIIEEKTKFNQPLDEMGRCY